MSGIYHEIISPLMNSENSIVKDPLGNIVFLSEELCLKDTEPLKEMYDPVARIIEAPAYMVEVPGTELYYIRAVDWDNIMLVEASMQDGKWRAFTCVKNPSREFIGSIIKRGKLITKW
jgi:hypothetical protein